MPIIRPVFFADRIITSHEGGFAGGLHVYRLSSYLYGTVNRRVPEAACPLLILWLEMLSKTVTTEHKDHTENH